MAAESVRFRVGEFACVALPDVINPITEDDIRGMFPDAAERILAAFRALPAPDPFCQNILFVDTGNKRVLIDSGVGDARSDTPGQLVDRLRS